jgi:hypothetical protein
LNRATQPNPAHGTRLSEAADRNCRDHLEVIVEDQLIDLIANICFQAPIQLHADQSFGAHMARYPGEFYLEIVDADTRLFGNAVFTPDGKGEAELIARTADVLSALHDCGHRALAFFHQRLDADPAMADTVAGLDALDQETATTLRHGEPGRP